MQRTIQVNLVSKIIEVMEIVNLLGFEFPRENVQHVYANKKKTY